MSYPVHFSLTLLVSLVGLIFTGCQSHRDQPGSAREAAPVVVSVPDDPRWPLTQRERVALKASGMTQISMPFGVLLAADEDMPVAHVQQAAAILAEMMDQNMDGLVDDPRVAEALVQRDICWLAMPMSPERWEDEQLPRLERVLGYDIIIPEWWMDVHGPEPDDHARAVMVEEIHHFMTQFGFSEVYPDVFGVNDWNSVIARETQRAQCDFWQHPENDCPGRRAEIVGDCSDPNCDVVEFYQQVAVIRAGMQPGWHGIDFPRERDVLESMLSDEFKEAVSDPQYHQLQGPLSFSYPLD